MSSFVATDCHKIVKLLDVRICSELRPLSQYVVGLRFLVFQSIQSCEKKKEAVVSVRNLEYDINCLMMSALINVDLPTPVSPMSKMLISFGFITDGVLRNETGGCNRSIDFNLHMQ